MRFSRILAAHLVLPALVTLPRPASAQGQPANADADTVAIKQVFTDFYENFSRHDAHADALCFTEDADFTNMTGIHSHGRQEIEKRLASLFQGLLKDATRTDIVRSVRFFGPHVATVDADTTIIGTKLPDGSVIPPRKGLMIVTMTKQNGRWLIATFHEAEFPPPRRAAASAPAGSIPQ
jgi:uncharacterized protein (TIGR02246 family)